MPLISINILTKKKNLRLIEIDINKPTKQDKQLVSINGGLLVQDQDVKTKDVTADMTVTNTKPTEQELIDMDFGWKIVKHVKSNAIVIVKDGVTEALAQCEANGIRLIDKAPRSGADGLKIAFLHPKSTCGILTELCEE